MHSDDGQVEVPASFLDAGITIVQSGDVCYAKESGTHRVWAWISRRHDGTPVPDGYFFLRDVYYNKVMIKELLDHKAIELGDPVRLPSGELARTARLCNG